LRISNLVSSLGIYSINKMQREDLTIIYYTCNREEKSFENKVRQRLLETAKNIPIISVSHKPIKLGRNICVGVHYPSNLTLYRQLLIGAKAAKTTFVANAEADFLYPPEYFSFLPKEEEKIYRYGNIRLMYKYHWGFFPKQYSEGAQIAGRKYLISVLENALKACPEWFEEDSPHFRKLDPYKNISFEMFTGNNACVTFKTGQSLHKYSAISTHSVPSLPYWGTAVEMRKAMFGL